jgi:fumarate hydratase, class I
MIGKAERGAAAADCIRANGAVYLIAVGGAAYLVAQAIRSSKVVAWPDLDMEAIRELQVRDMPVTVAIDGAGASVHDSGPQIWRGHHVPFRPS